jgi:hypothetical protein
MLLKGINPSQEGPSKTPRRARYSDFSFQRPKPEDPRPIIRIYNLGCQDLSPFDFSRPILWQRMPTALRKVASSIPVFLVNSWQMHAIYPPSRKTVLLDEKILEYCRKVAAIPLEVEDRHNPPQELLFLFLLEGKEFSSRWWGETYEPFVTMGLYLPKPPALQRILERSPENMGTGKGIRSQEEAKQVLQNHQGPVIFLCCECICDTAKSEGMAPNLVLDMVYYHELGHALLDVEESLWDTSEDPYNVPFGRIIEESAANWIAYYCFTGKEAGLVQRLIHRQPIEYQGYAAFEEAPVLFLGKERVYHHLLKKDQRLIFLLLGKEEVKCSFESIFLSFYWRRPAWFYQSWPAIWHAEPVISFHELDLHWAGQGAIDITMRVSGPPPSALYQTIQHNWGLWSRPTASPEERAKLNMLWWVAYKELGAPREKKGYYVFPLSFLVFAYYLLLRGAFS